MSNEEKLAIIQRARDLLCEHFEAGEILVQDHDPEIDETSTWVGGWGNRLARDRHIALRYQDRVILNDEDEDEDGDDEDGDDDDNEPASA
jgi:hypothetical protein